MIGPEAADTLAAKMGPRMRQLTDYDWYRRTLELVQQRHAGKTDKLGWPYYEHFTNVAERLVRLFPGATRAQIEAALLHDALEPGNLTAEELSRQGFSDETLRILKRITLPTDGRSYQQYVDDLVKTGDLEAIQVKLADNLDAYEFYSTRTDAASKQALEEKFEPARRALQEGLGAEAGRS